MSSNLSQPPSTPALIEKIPDKYRFSITSSGFDNLVRTGIEMMPDKPYHNSRHVRFVLDESIELLDSSGLSPKEAEVTILGAAFHDVGHLDTYESHERNSINYFNKKAEEVDGVSGRLVECVEQTILDTRFDAEPETRPGAILSDADTASLARPTPDVLKDMFDIRHEKPPRNQTSRRSIEETLENLVELLETHSYSTDVGRERYSQSKDVTLTEVRTMLQGFRTTDSHSVEGLTEQIDNVWGDINDFPRLGYPYAAFVISKDIQDIREDIDTEEECVEEFADIIINATRILSVNGYDVGQVVSNRLNDHIEKDPESLSEKYEQLYNQQRDD